jgi:hypothetical protein
MTEDVTCGRHQAGDGREKIRNSSHVAREYSSTGRGQRTLESCTTWLMHVTQWP